MTDTDTTTTYAPQLNARGELVLWTISRTEGYPSRDYIGLGLAHLAHNDLHPYVVWNLYSDDGLTFDAGGGDYCGTYNEALMRYIERGGRH